ncbi:MAG TPA: hypothetical protein VK707_08390 [Solirubrobacteraceae bacterium]|jgi:hypothetical protein|nr:hypothetical protein [Solirubrobacteraceae bacterium]
MRRASTCLALLGSLAVLGLPAVASAAPTVTFKAKAVPIPKPGGGTYPGTGNILGAGSALEANFVLTGTGYGATPQNPAGGIPPLAGVNFFLPAGAKINSAGFPTCAESVLKNTGPSGCSKGSVASPKGNALGEVTFGTERVPEEASLQAFFGSNKGLLFYVNGTTPVSLEFVSSGTYVNSGQPPYGLELQTTVPAIKTVPGAPLASTKNINIKVGAAIKKGKKLISYGSLPTKCPSGGFPLKAELIFGGSYGGEREFGIPAETVTTTYKAPCPPKGKK